MVIQTRDEKHKNTTAWEVDFNSLTLEEALRILNQDNYNIYRAADRRGAYKRILVELSQIKNAKPSLALELVDKEIENITAKLEKDIKLRDKTNVISHHNIVENCCHRICLYESRLKELNTIEQALQKAQENNELIEGYDLKPYELREALLLYAMYKGEYKGNPLPTLKQYKEQEKVLEILFKKNVEMNLLNNSNTLDEYNSNRNWGAKYLTKEEFELLKHYFGKNIQKQ